MRPPGISCVPRRHNRSCWEDNAKQLLGKESQMPPRFTQKAQNVFNLSLESASEMGHTYIGSEHLLLGLLKEEAGIAAHCLSERGADRNAVYQAISVMAGIGNPT
ncbi:MAG: Clp protease N-terminal domain-containing protein, partial [Clostridia bacterium]|nr:Clp protease N-terminal domain-containing protein [Clostridia bacterium]